MARRRERAGDDLRRLDRDDRGRDDRGGRRERGRDRDDREPSRRGGRSRGGFEYHRRGAEARERRATQRGGAFDNPWRSDVRAFRVHDGKNRIRILPPTWTEADGKPPDHFGVDIWVHRNVGPDNSMYACLGRSGRGGDGCPVCEEIERAGRERDPDDKYVDELKAIRRVAIWVIDRNKEDDGPMLWLSPWTFDDQLDSTAKDDDSGELLDVDDPDEGYDVQFDKPKGMHPYSGVVPVRRSSPLSSDRDEAGEWLAYVQDNPIPDVLVRHDYEHIALAFSGGRRGGDQDEPDRERPRSRRADDDAPRGGRRSRLRDDDEREERGSRRRLRDDDEPDRGRRGPAGDAWYDDPHDDEPEDDDAHERHERTRQEEDERRPRRGRASSGRESRGRGEGRSRPRDDDDDVPY